MTKLKVSKCACVDIKTEELKILNVSSCLLIFGAPVTLSGSAFKVMIFEELSFLPEDIPTLSFFLRLKIHIPLTFHLTETGSH